MNHYILAIIAILSALSTLALTHIANDVPMVWLAVLILSNIAIGLVFGIFKGD